MYKILNILHIQHFQEEFSCYIFKFHCSCTLFSLYPEPPSLSLHPSTLPLTVPGQILTLYCEASGFAPLTLHLSWEYKDTKGKTRSLGSGSVTGHRQATDGTYSQSTQLELNTTTLDLGRGGELTCVAVHLGGTRRASVSLNMIGNMEEITLFFKVYLFIFTNKIRKQIKKKKIRLFLYS